MDQRLLQKLIADAQKNKKILDQKIIEIQNSVFTTVQGKGLMEMTMNGKYEVLSCKVRDELMEDKESLEDLIISSVNELISKINKEMKDIEDKFVPKGFF